MFVSLLHLDRMAKIVRAAQTAIELPAYREIVQAFIASAFSEEIRIFVARSMTTARIMISLVVVPRPFEAKLQNQPAHALGHGGDGRLDSPYHQFWRRACSRRRRIPVPAV